MNRGTGGDGAHRLSLMQARGQSSWTCLTCNGWQSAMGERRGELLVNLVSMD
jgi:hypothetical protein